MVTVTEKARRRRVSATMSTFSGRAGLFSHERASEHTHQADPQRSHRLSGAVEAQAVSQRIV
jgi:hypothetical protein